MPLSDADAIAALSDEYDLHLAWQEASGKYVLEHADGSSVSKKTFDTPSAALAHVKKVADKAEERFWERYGEHHDDIFNELLQE